jgi:hypothetical protein
MRPDHGGHGAAREESPAYRQGHRHGDDHICRCGTCQRRAAIHVAAGTAKGGGSIIHMAADTTAADGTVADRTI